MSEHNKIYIDPKTGEKACKCFKRCGGCQLSESYKAQLERKQQRLNVCFQNSAMSMR